MCGRAPSHASWTVVALASARPSTRRSCRGLAPAPVAAQTAPTPAPNPPIEESCGVDVTLVLDASGSISSSSHAVEDVRDAAEAFLDALENTNSTARVTQFGNRVGAARPEHPRRRRVARPGRCAAATPSTATTTRSPAADRRRPSTSTGSGNPLSAGSFRPRTAAATSTPTGTRPRPGRDRTPPELVVFVTDGDPTAYDFDQAGDPFPPPAVDVAYGTDGSSEAAQVTLDRAVEEANAIKAGGTRMLAVGVGSALEQPGQRRPARRRLRAAGRPRRRPRRRRQPQRRRRRPGDGLRRPRRSSSAASCSQLCSPSLTIRKLAQSPTTPPTSRRRVVDDGDADALPDGTGFRWILPDTGAGGRRRRSSRTPNGFAQFQWEPIPAGVGLAGHRPGDAATGLHAGPTGRDDDFRCELRDEDGDVRVGRTVSFGPTAHRVHAQPDRPGDRHLHGLELVRLRPGDRASPRSTTRRRSAATSTRRRR